MSDSPAMRVLVMDVDGVVSPVHGHTDWGDDVIAGQVFGDVLVSPTLCRRLDQLTARPAVTALWLTSWPTHLREAMQPFPGATWPEITSQADDPEQDWWKWGALLRWLDDHHSVGRLAWCDDHLDDTHLHDLHDDGAAPTDLNAQAQPIGLAAIRAELTRRRIDALLMAPRTDVGLTRHQLEGLERFLTPR